MIRLIAAIDSKRGIAKNGQIPWDLPSDKAHFQKLTLEYGANVLMGRRTYESMGDYLIGRHNYVVTHAQLSLPSGCTLVNDLDSFLSNSKQDIWVIGGAEIYKSSIKYSDELYLTTIEANFDCDQFFPEFKEYKLRINEGPFLENDLKFSYQLFTRF